VQLPQCSEHAGKSRVAQFGGAKQLTAGANISRAARPARPVLHDPRVVSLPPSLELD
jgi:hypothetical protein